MNEPIIALNNVYKFIGKNKILSNVNLCIFPGEIHVLIGENGAGKTTILKCLTGLLKTDKGKSSIFGETSYGLSSTIKSQLGTVLDEKGLYDNLTGLENILFFGELYGYKKNIIEDRFRHYSELLDLKREDNKKVSTYSKGMRQKLCIIRELIHEPKLLILDEPFNGLDPNVRAILRNFLLSLQKEGLTIVISSHDLYDIEKIASHVSMVREGTIMSSKAMEMMNDAYSVIVDSIEDANKLMNIEGILVNNCIGTKLQVILTKNLEISKILLEHKIGIKEIYKERTKLESYFDRGGKNI